MAKRLQPYKKIFISWSGDNSKQIAIELKNTLENGIFNGTGLECFVSDVDISSGDDWWNKIKKELKSCTLGIICITKENLKAPWVFFESGAMVARDVKVIPLLFHCDIKSLNGTPIANKNMVNYYDQEKFKKMIQNINKELNLLTITPENLDIITSTQQDKMTLRLANVFKKLKEMRIFNEKYIFPSQVSTVNINTIFISAPMSSVTEEEYNKLRTLVFSLKNTLESIGFEKVVCPLFSNDDYEKFDGSTKAINENFLELKQVDSLIVIYPKQIPSSVLVETGYALALSKKTVIFYHDSLPYMLKDAATTIEHIDTRQYNNFDDIIKIIESNGKQLFNMKDNEKQTFKYSKTPLFQMLLEKKFIFSTDIEESEIAKTLFLNKLKNDDEIKITIYVTNDCNFKCVYCPQDHEKKYMSIETMDLVCKFIEEVIATGTKRKLVVSWFGGEPLLNLKIIEHGMHQLRNICESRGVAVSSGMTTNGYTLTPDCLQKLIKIGITEYQITLDGNDLTHNQNRMLINGDGTWNQIWNNLLDINKLPTDFQICIRINVNAENIDSANDLITKIENTFDNERFYIRVQPIINMGKVTDNATYCSNIEAQLIPLLLYSNFNYKNFGLEIEQLIEPFGLMCHCSDYNHYVITVDGDICKCELNINDASNIIGNVKYGFDGIIMEKAAGYITPDFSKKCEQCRFFPMCFGLSCPYKRINKKNCIQQKTFLIDEYIKTIAKKLEQYNS